MLSRPEQPYAEQLNDDGHENQTPNPGELGCVGGPMVAQVGGLASSSAAWWSFRLREFGGVAVVITFRRLCIFFCGCHRCGFSGVFIVRRSW